MDHSSHTLLHIEELDTPTVEGAEIYGLDDRSIGTISSLHGSGHTAQAVIDVGGFLGLGSKRVALPVGNLNFMRDASGNVYAGTTMTKEELKNLSEHAD